MPTYTFNSGSGTFTVPAGEALSQIEAWGAGGGGGSGDAAPGEGGAGGGGGGYSKKTYASVASGTVFAYSVGAAGSGQTGGSEQDGGAGGNTTVTQAGLSLNMAANGGGGGISGANGNGPGTGGAGGTASGGDTNTTGTAGTDTTGSSSGKAGGAAANGGAGGAAGIAGTAPGGGGGGGNRHGNSGAGAAGRITFTTTLVVTSNSPDDLTDAEYTWYKTRSTSTVAKSPLVEMQRTYWISVVGATGSGISNQEIEMNWLRSLTGVVSSQYGDMWREAVAGIGKVPQNSISQNKLIYYKNVP